MENSTRGSWKSNWGFLMAAVGSAVGLGNIWGFPYKMGANGGFAFLLVYLVLAVLVGAAVMLGELTIGRKTGKSSVEAYGYFAEKYKWIGMMGIIAGVFILAFYSVIGGMVVRYAMAFMLEIFGMDGFAGQGTGFFGYLIYDSGSVVLFNAIFMGATILIVMGGIEKGIERFTSIAMPVLVVLMLVIIIYVALQPGAAAGYAFMFTPNFEPLQNDFMEVLRSAAGQMFFSLSLGMGCMITYGSYLSKSENLQKNALIIPGADTLMALLAGCVVMPACAAFGVDFGGGPGLLFVSMHQVFINMGTLGNIIGFLFYLFVVIAALTSSISLLEVLISYQVDKNIKKGAEPKRKVTSLIYGVFVFLMGLPVALDALGSGGSTMPSPHTILGIEAGSEAHRTWNASWLDFYDMISEGILMPLGALIMSLLIGWVIKTQMIKDECELSGHKFKAFGFYDIGFKFIVPVGMAFVLYAQILAFFG